MFTSSNWKRQIIQKCDWIGISYTLFLFEEKMKNLTLLFISKNIVQKICDPPVFRNGEELPKTLRYKNSHQMICQIIDQNARNKLNNTVKPEIEGWTHDEHFLGRIQPLKTKPVSILHNFSAVRMDQPWGHLVRVELVARLHAVELFRRTDTGPALQRWVWRAGEPPPNNRKLTKES